jgi:hypothetical protein
VARCQAPKGNPWTTGVVRSPSFDKLHDPCRASCNLQFDRSCSLQLADAPRSGRRMDRAVGCDWPCGGGVASLSRNNKFWRMGRAMDRPGGRARARACSRVVVA